MRAFVRLAFTIFILAFNFFPFNFAAAADVVTITGNISVISNGWGGEGYYFTLQNASAATNCPNAQRFLIPATFAGYQGAVGNVMLAYSLNSNVTVNIQGCVNGFANVLGVNPFR